MNEDFGIRLQAYLDGELDSRGRQEVEATLSTDPQARALEQELRMVGEALKAADPVVSVPESREFYWSKIARSIEAAEVAGDRVSPAVAGSFAAWLRRAVLPLSGVAAACLMLLVSLRQGALPVVAMPGETESPLAETGALTFRSEAERVTVVWLYDKDQPADESDTEKLN